MKLWTKSKEALDPLIERFTVGNDYLLDRRLVQYDCRASKAHAEMLCKIDVLTAAELDSLNKALDEIVVLDRRGEFSIERRDEDCHTAIEAYLTEKLGDTGKKIHTGRSRNDQVLVALRLYEKDAVDLLVELLDDYCDALSLVITKSGAVGLPGYTHMQKAMPATVAMWLGSFLASAATNRALLTGAKQLIDECPLGTAAGFGVPAVLGIDRQLTSDRLGFAKVMENPMTSQLTRGKLEAVILNACSQIGYDLNKLASDLILFNMSEFGLVELDAKICTGSSIMPQKKNPDVLELLRAKYHVILGEEFKVKSLIGNLISGYNRDLQLTKEALFNGIDTTEACLQISAVVMGGLTVNSAACQAALTDELYATERAYELVRQGVPFREAYKIVAQKIAENKTKR